MVGSTLTAVLRHHEPPLVPNQHVRQRSVNLPEKRVAHPGQSSEQSKVEAPIARVPAVIAAGGGGRNDRLQTSRCEVAQIVPSQDPSGLAKKLHAAKGSATQRVDTAGPGALDTPDRAPDICCDDARVQAADSSPALDHSRPGEADPGRTVTPLAGPSRLAVATQVGPVHPPRVIGGILEGQAFRCGSDEILAPGGSRQGRERVCETRCTMRHSS